MRPLFFFRGQCWFVRLFILFHKVFGSFVDCLLYIQNAICLYTQIYACISQMLLVHHLCHLVLCVYLIFFCCCFCCRCYLSDISIENKSLTIFVVHREMLQIKPSHGHCVNTQKLFPTVKSNKSHLANCYNNE